MPDNLEFKITADSSKARYEMELLTPKMQALQKEIKATREEAAKGNPQAIANLKAQTAAMDAMVKSYAALNRAANASKRAFAESAEGFRLHERNLKSLHGALTGIGEAIAGVRGGMIGFIAAFTFDKIMQQLDGVSKRLTELQKTAGEIGIKPIALQAVREIAAEAGQDADDATKIMQGLGKVIEENRRKFGAPVGGGSGLPVVLRAGTAATPTPGVLGLPSGNVNVLRGGQAELRDPTKALAEFDPSRFPATAVGFQQAILAVQKRILELSKTMNSVDFNVFARQFGVSGEAMRKNAEAEIPKIIAKIKELEGAARGATAEAEANNEKLIASQAELAKAYENAVSTMATTLQPAQIAFNELLAEALPRVAKKFQSDMALVAEAWHRDAQQFQTDIANITQAWQTFWTGIVDTAKAGADAIQSIWQSLTGAASSIAGAVSGAVSRIGQAAAQGGAAPFARGGYVQGPGTGTSDSILARVSAGEYVVNAARVRQVGLNFMNRLNGFADGGFVNPAPLRFAAGGMVPTGGTPVHLHIGAKQFITQASGAVADALVREARAQGMRSAGIKPSWVS